MMSIYPQAKEAWYDYYNNGFQHISEGSFMQDFIAFFRKHDEDSHFECFKKFYEENFPHFTIIQKINYHKNLNESEFNEFFESSPSKIQNDFIDFCYVSIEEHNFAPEFLWIMPEDAIPPEVPSNQSTTDHDFNTIQNNIIDPEYDDMPPLEGEMPPLEAHPPAPPGEEVSNVWAHNWKPNNYTHQESQLYAGESDSSDDEMPPLIDETDEEIPPLEGNPIAISSFMTAEIPPFESDDDTTFDEMPELIDGGLMSDDEMPALDSGEDEILWESPVLI